MSSASRRAVEYSRGPEAEKPVPEPSPRGSAASTVLASMTVVGATALFLATLMPVLRVTVDNRVITALDQTGWDKHGAALLALAILAIVLLRPALLGSQPAAVAIALAGLAAIVITVAADLPDIGDTGAVGSQLDTGKVGAGFGAYLEVLGGVLLLAAGGFIAMTNRRD
jgi:hypothetical protein